MTSPATQFFNEHPRAAVIAIILAVVPFGLVVIVPSALASYILIAVPVCLVLALGLSIVSLFKAHQAHRASALAWIALVVSALEGIYLISFFFSS